MLKRSGQFHFGKQRLNVINLIKFAFNSGPQITTKKACLGMLGYLKSTLRKHVMHFLLPLNQLQLSGEWPNPSNCSTKFFSFLRSVGLKLGKLDHKARTLTTRPPSQRIKVQRWGKDLATACSWKQGQDLQSYGLNFRFIRNHQRCVRFIYSYLSVRF